MTNPICDLPPSLAVLTTSLPSIMQPTTSPFAQLPSELMRQIFMELVPHKVTFVFTQLYSSRARKTRRYVQAHSRDNSENSSDLPYHPSCIVQADLSTYASLLRTSRMSYLESRAVLYSTNHFSFSSTLCMSRGKLGLMQAHNLREIRNIELVLETYRPAAEHERFLKSFVKMISAQGEDASNTSMLKRLQVRLEYSGLNCKYEELAAASSAAACVSYLSNRSIESCMFTLEALTELPKVGQVRIFGPPAWLVHCLETCIQDGGGSAVPELCWQTRKTKHHAAHHGSVRLAGQPILDWQQFAQRNGIALLENVTGFYRRHNTSCPRQSIEVMSASVGTVGRSQDH